MVTETVVEQGTQARAGGEAVAAVARAYWLDRTRRRCVHLPPPQRRTQCPVLRRSAHLAPVTAPITSRQRRRR